MIFLFTYQSSPPLPSSCEYEAAGTATILNQNNWTASCKNNVSFFCLFLLSFFRSFGQSTSIYCILSTLTLCGYKDLVYCYLLSITMHPFIVKMSDSNKFSLMDPRWRICFRSWEQGDSILRNYLEGSGNHWRLLHVEETWSSFAD